MVSVLKFFGKGILYVLVCPFALLALLVVAIFGLFEFVFLFFKNLFLFFTGRSLFDDLEEDKKVKAIKIKQEKEQALSNDASMSYTTGLYNNSTIDTSVNKNNDKTPEEKETFKNEIKETVIEENEEIVNEDNNVVVETFNGPTPKEEVAEAKDKVIKDSISKKENRMKLDDIEDEIFGNYMPKSSQNFNEKLEKEKNEAHSGVDFFDLGGDK